MRINLFKLVYMQANSQKKCGPTYLDTYIIWPSRRTIYFVTVSGLPSSVLFLIAARTGVCKNGLDPKMASSLSLQPNPVPQMGSNWYAETRGQSATNHERVLYNNLLRHFEVACHNAPNGSEKRLYAKEQGLRLLYMATCPTSKWHPGCF